MIETRCSKTNVGLILNRADASGRVSDNNTNGNYVCLRSEMFLYCIV